METYFDNFTLQKNILDLRSTIFLSPYNNRVSLKIRADFHFGGKPFSWEKNLIPKTTLIY